MAKKSKAMHVTCTCCGLLHDPSHCSQCVAAGCNHKAKAAPCQQNATVLALTKMPEWKVREEYAKLQLEHSKLTEESQRLVRIIYSIDPKLLETRGAALPMAASPEGANLHG